MTSKGKGESRSSSKGGQTRGTSIGGADSPDRPQKGGAPRDDDVCFSRAGMNHPGNVRWWDDIADANKSFESCFSDDVVNFVRERDNGRRYWIPARTTRQDAIGSRTKVWVEASAKQIREQIFQRFRHETRRQLQSKRQNQQQQPQDLAKQGRKRSVRSSVGSSSSSSSPPHSTRPNLESLASSPAAVGAAAAAAAASSSPSSRSSAAREKSVGTVRFQLPPASLSRAGVPPRRHLSLGSARLHPSMSADNDPRNELIQMLQTQLRHKQAELAEMYLQRDRLMANMDTLQAKVEEQHVQMQGQQRLEEKLKDYIRQMVGQQTNILWDDEQHPQPNTAPIIPQDDSKLPAANVPIMPDISLPPAAAAAGNAGAAFFEIRETQRRKTESSSSEGTPTHEDTTAYKDDTTDQSMDADDNSLNSMLDYFLTTMDADTPDPDEMTEEHFNEIFRELPPNLINEDKHEAVRKALSAMLKHRKVDKPDDDSKTDVSEPHNALTIEEKVAKALNYLEGMKNKLHLDENNPAKPQAENSAGFNACGERAADVRRREGSHGPAPEPHKRPPGARLPPLQSRRPDAEPEPEMKSRPHGSSALPTITEA